MKLAFVFEIALAVGLVAPNTLGANDAQAMPVEAVFLLTEGRSGSTFVGELLNQDKR
jgi:hypothetical protein